VPTRVTRQEHLPRYPIVAICHDFARNTPELQGIWGAITAQEESIPLSTPERSDEIRVRAWSAMIVMQ
jgi:hypothetical protein